MWVASIFWLQQIMLFWTWVYQHLFETLLSVLFGVYPVVLLDHMIILALPYWETAPCFPQRLYHFVFPLLVHKLSSFFKSLPTLICFVFIFVFDSSHPNGCEYLIVVLTCISLILSDARYLYIYLLATCLSSLLKCLFKPFALFSICLCVLL